MSSFVAAIPGLIFLTLCYTALCAVSPFGNCRKCKGFGFHLKRGRLTGHLKPGRTCRRCHGDRIRIRTGRHLWNVARRIHRDGTR
ncbi:hypothetical protein DVA86_27950 [Streptomyces armeniacus]|uniref:Uncharacterized protein n=1 Tax=Streptomyces armeniacus TaxID=83291 RepID=A0A345XW72_9ACTN|nr:hypothetical protein [Streptomyces armeniacus]AXK35888.1 hypothetical protein DVA86_27950 [Streptomyces armeniacus]